MLKEFQLLVITVTLLCHGSELKGEKHYINKWAAQIEGGLDQATRIAKRHGYSLVEAVSTMSYCDISVLCTVCII